MPSGPAISYLDDVVLPEGVVVSGECPHPTCVQLFAPANELPVPSDPTAAHEALARYQDEQLLPLLRGMDDLTSVSAWEGCDGERAMHVGIARFIRLPDFVAVIAELMAHQRSPRIVVCGGVRTELAEAEAEADADADADHGARMTERGKPEPGPGLGLGLGLGLRPGLQ